MQTWTLAALAATLLAAGGSMTPPVAAKSADPAGHAPTRRPRERVCGSLPAADRRLGGAGRRLVTYVAVAHTASRDQQPVLGTLKVEADTTVAIAERLVSFATLRIAETNFASLARDRVRRSCRECETAMPEFERVIALDRVLAHLDRSRILARNIEEVKANPPAIFFQRAARRARRLRRPARFESPIKDNDLRYAVNTDSQ